MELGNQLGWLRSAEIGMADQDLTGLLRLTRFVLEINWTNLGSVKKSVDIIDPQKSRSFFFNLGLSQI